MFVLCVCGGRDYSDREKVFSVLSRIHAKKHITKLIQGGASGADRLAKEWATFHGIDQIEIKADWNAYGKRAGPMRNAEMLSRGFNGLVAFPGGRGTLDMVTRTKSSGITVMEVSQ